MTTMASHVDVEIRAPAAIIRLNRPEKRNALTADTLLAIAAAVERFDVGDDVRVLILTGEGGAFSAGADLREALELETGPQTLVWNRAWQRSTKAIEGSPLPVIAAIGGACMTGGLELALACDLRVAGADARFAVTSVGIGSVAGGGATQRLPRLIGVSNAKDLLFSARVIDAEEAGRFGLVNRVVEAGTHEAAAQAWAAELAERAPLSLWLTKWAVNRGIEMPLDAALDWEGTLSAHAFASDDRREGMTAFLEKRKPRFRGR
jgi:enoyl-CoA hydratase/carnithine racemase